MTDDLARIIAQLEVVSAQLKTLDRDVNALRKELPQLRGDLTLVMARQNSVVMENKKKLAGLPKGSAGFTAG